MAGHDKWSKVKRLKAVTDSRKGQVFLRLSRDITMAAKAGGSAVAFQFLHVDQFLLAKDRITEDKLLEVALEAGDNDVQAIFSNEEMDEAVSEAAQAQAERLRPLLVFAYLSHEISPPPSCCRQFARYFPRRRSRHNHAARRCEAGCCWSGCPH